MIASGNRTHISVLRDVADAIQCVVQLRLMADGSRVVSEIVKVLGYNAVEDVFRTVSVYSLKGGVAPEA
jgi:Flp pilus assembly CpaF family ATPase